MLKPDGIAERNGEDEEVELEGVVQADPSDLEQPMANEQDPEEDQEPGKIDEKLVQGEQEPKTGNEGLDPVPQTRKSSNRSRCFKICLQVILVVCQIVILAVGVSYILWWPENINIFSNERDWSESLGDTHDEEVVLQKWQSSYLGLSLLFTFYGCCAQDRGWLMIAMFMNIGIMSLFPFKSFRSEAQFTLIINIFAVFSVYGCYMLSERVQDMHMQTGHVPIAHSKCLFFDIPDMKIYHMGIFQTLNAITLVFLGLAQMWLQEQMITEPARDSFSCADWPEGKCARYYGLQAQEYYVARLATAMVAAGGVGLLGGIFRHRTLLILAMTLTIVPFFGIIQNSVYTMGTAEDVTFMCTDAWWLANDRVVIFWGDNWECKTQETYYLFSVVLMIASSTLSLMHLWVCLRFSEKLQSWAEADENDVDRNLADRFRCICYINQPMKLYKYTLLFLAMAIIAGGSVQIHFGMESDKSTQTATNYLNQDVVVLDSPSYIDTPIVYGIYSILAGLLTFAFACTNSRTILSLVFCLVIQSLSIGWQNCLWHQIDLEYGIVQFATNSINVYPLHIAGDARDHLWMSIQCYWGFLGASILMLFFCVMTHEAMQDEENIINNDAQKWAIRIGRHSIRL